MIGRVDEKTGEIISDEIQNAYDSVFNAVVEKYTGTDVVKSSLKNDIHELTDYIKEETERIFYLNPFDIPGIEYSEEAGKVHGYSKEVIETFEPSSVMVKKIDDFLNDMVNFRQHERMFFVGYNGGFDYDHLQSLFHQ